MSGFIGKTIKDVEMNRGVFCIIFEDGSVGAVNLCLSSNINETCVNEIYKSIANKETYLFAVLRDN